MIGTSIGSYCILSKLGEGGMGAVYVAEHVLLRRRAAIKVLLPELSRRPEVVERFFNEARASAAIGDVGVVQVFDFGYHVDSSAFIVMELLEGESLDARLRRVGALAVRDALRVVRQMAQTLATVHARGVIHRDLKPDNVFLVPDTEAENGERPKILDFGIAKLTEGEGPGISQTRTGSLMGTPLYMSPEQCKGTGGIDRRSDVYALGCVLFYLMCGRPPFEGLGTGELLVKHVTEAAPPPSAVRGGIPAAVDALVLRCLEKDPASRFQDMTAVAQAVAAVQAQLTGGGLAQSDGLTLGHDWRRPTPPPPAPTTLTAASGANAVSVPPRKSRAAVIAMGMVGAAMAAAALVVLLGRGGASPLPGSLSSSTRGGAAIDAGAAVAPAPDATAIGAVTPVDAALAFPAVIVDAATVVVEVAPDAGTAEPEAKPSKPRKPKKKREQEDPYALPTP